MTSTFSRTKSQSAGSACPHPTQDLERKAGCPVGWFSPAPHLRSCKVIVHGHVSHPNLDLLLIWQNALEINKSKTQDKQNKSGQRAFF